MHLTWEIFPRKLCVGIIPTKIHRGRWVLHRHRRKEEAYGSARCNHIRQRPDRRRLTRRRAGWWNHGVTYFTAEGDAEMSVGNIWKSTAGLAAILAVTVAFSAWGREPGRAGFGGPGPFGDEMTPGVPPGTPSGTPPSGEPGGPCLGPRTGGHSLGLLQELIYPCEGSCLSNAHACSDAADSAALSSISGTCSKEIQAAQSACAADRTAQACQDALTALQTCAQSALSARLTALVACRTALLSCRQACAPTPTPTP
jgi:hypothetical protein